MAGEYKLKEQVKAIAKQARVVISKGCFKASNKKIVSCAEYSYDEVAEINDQYSLFLNNVYFHYYSVKVSRI